jgi:hypothetical protein
VTRGRPEPLTFPVGAADFDRHAISVCKHVEREADVARAAAVICVLCLAGCVACLVVAALIVLP